MLQDNFATIVNKCFQTMYAMYTYTHTYEYGGYILVRL